MPPTPETIRYAFAETTEGRVLVGVSDAGVAWVSLGDDEGAALAAMTRRFPRAEFELAGAEHDDWIASVVAHVDSPEHPGAEPPLDLRGTEFQRDVWNAMRAIPFAETRSYSEIARTIGRPRAMRAVGQACGANPVMVVVPCHRVTAADGLGGFGGGLDLKRSLLRREGVL